ncbi:hypothetical protein F5890DRAFT_609788 [Lentinula detonsa]|uniref:Uncharacterized protein n=1 Tax=Lentinula detonsa TaxID=2804962 RepID=A0AA38PTK6_9AGAR|nr:hypothetical protein F5890DRAFT_609788 [Lentinula detonsa]
MQVQPELNHTDVSRSYHFVWSVGQALQATLLEISYDLGADPDFRTPVSKSYLSFEEYLRFLAKQRGDYNCVVFSRTCPTFPVALVLLSDLVTSGQQEADLIASRKVTAGRVNSRSCSIVPVDVGWSALWTGGTKVKAVYLERVDVCGSVSIKHLPRYGCCVIISLSFPKLKPSHFQERFKFHHGSHDLGIRQMPTWFNFR